MSSTLNHSVLRTHAFEPLEVEGRLPEGLRGTLHRAGPGLLERFGGPVAHPFDADGAITSIRFEDQRASGACRVVASAEFREEERAGRFLYGTSAGRTRQVLNNLLGRRKSTGNTNLLSWQGRLLALMENAAPVELDPDTLDTQDVTTLGIVREAFAAHPHRVEKLKTTFNFGLRGRWVDLYALPDVGVARVLGSFQLPWVGMIHDFIATDRHLVFIIGPAKLVTWRAVLAVGDLSQYFRWEPEAGAMVVVVPLAAPERLTQFQVEPFWVWHFANAFEDGGVVKVDLCRHDDFGAFEAPSSAGPEHSQPRLYRYSVDAAHRTLHGEVLWDEASEFPSVHAARTGARHRYVWLQTFPSARQLPGVARFDCETGDVERWGAPMDHLGAEPLFVARDERPSEHAGWVLQLFQDPRAGRSYLAVLDAERLADGPLAKVWLRERIPMTFHGVFVRGGR